MYKLLSIEDIVRVPPKRFGGNLKEVIVSEFENVFAGRIERDVGIILAVTDIRDISEGKIIMGDGAVYYNAVLDVVVYRPVINEVVEGRITETTNFGAFVNFGPIDGLIHISQVTDDLMTYDQKNAMLVGKETKKILKKGDVVRARIVTVGLKNRLSESKVGLTMRQPYLGKIEWLEDERKVQKGEKPAAAKKQKSEPKRVKRVERGGKK